MMREVLQQIPDAAHLGGGSGTSRQAGTWETSWAREASAVVTDTAAWWTSSDEGRALLRRIALAHLFVGVCVALVLGWRVWTMPETPDAAGLALMPATGLLVAIGGVLTVLFARLDRPGLLVWARLALVAVDLGAASGILWLRGDEGWALLVLLPPIALAIAFFAERGGALATILAALTIVAVNCARNALPSGWMPSLLVFLGTAVLVVAFLSVYSTRITETSLNLRWLLSDARAANDRLQGERQKLAVRLRSSEQAQEPLLHERARLAEAADELTMLARRMAQGDASAARTLRAVRPGDYGPLAELAGALARVSHTLAATGNQPWQQSGITLNTALEGPMRAQGQALEALDMLARTLCVNANELVVEARALEPGVSLIGSGQYTQALWQLEQHLRTQATYMALLGTQLADIRSTQEHLRAALSRAATGAKTPAIFATSDVRAPAFYSGPQVAFDASAIRRGLVRQPDEDALTGQRESGGTVRRGNWSN